MPGLPWRRTANSLQARLAENGKVVCAAYGASRHPFPLENQPGFFDFPDGSVKEDDYHA
jgi:hypothetical protein